jgi:predicted RNase H-like HicB family nuclease
MTKASEQRIKVFVDDFIHSEYVSNWTSGKDSDFINELDRADRCYTAAEFGADGKTYAEVIEDWREAFQAWIRDRRMWQEPERFIAGVNAHFDAVEDWHESHGSLFTEIG